ncbi:MAG: outer membrane beta-barrel protein [Cyclobacteriaceae bacterium]
MLTNQRNFQNLSSPTYGATISYVEPLGGRKYLEFNYNFTTDINKVDKEVFNEGPGGETVNTQLTNKYNSNYLYNKPALNLRINRDKYNIAFGVGLQETHLYGNLILKNTIIDRQFEMVQPAFHFNYDFNNFKRLRFDYTANMQEPTVSQLQPIVDNSDPLNLSQGNPHLSPAYSHQVRSNFTLFNPDNFMNMFALISANYTANAITSAQSINSQTLVRTTTPVNVKNSSNISGNFNIGVPVKKLNSRFNIGPNYSASKNINVLNETESTVTQQTLGGTTRYNYTLGEILILDLSANWSYQETKYSFNSQQSSSSTQNQYYLNKTYTAEANVNFLKNYAFNTEMDYFLYTSTTTNFHQTIPLWKMSVSRFMLKNKTGELKFTLNNILNYGVSISQTATSNYLQQVTNNNLGRYFIVSFTYALNKQLNPMNGMDRRRGGGGNRVIFRQ